MLGQEAVQFSRVGMRIVDWEQREAPARRRRWFADEHGTERALLDRYARMVLIRNFENEIHRLFLKGEVHGTTRPRKVWMTNPIVISDRSGVSRMEKTCSAAAEASRRAVPPNPRRSAGSPRARARWGSGSARASSRRARTW